jgi:hypothetical protein
MILLIPQPSDPPIYLDFGGALAAFGLIFAVYQLRKPQWDVVLRIRNNWQKNLFWILGGMGLLFTLIRILITNSFIYYWIFPFNHLLFYEIAAYIFFISSPLSLIYFSTKAKGLFNKNTAAKFYEVLIQEISRTNSEGVGAALEVLLYNFRDICKIAHDGKKDEDITQLSRAVLDVVLSDESIAKILTTKRLDALQFIFAIVEKQGISRRESGIGIPKLVKKLFYNKESFFYKHLDRDGLALSSNIYESIFDSPVILTNFDLFGYPTFGYSMEKEINLEEINVFIEALSRSIKTYLKDGRVPPRHINNGLSHLSEIFGDICFKINLEEGRGIDTKYSLKNEWWALHIIAIFLGHDYLFLGHDEKLNQSIVDKEKTATEANPFSELTINEGIAATIYKAFEQLSYIEKSTDIYDIVHDLTHGMIYESNLKNGYRDPFEKRMWQQIGANVIRRHYPAALKTYLVNFGYYLGSNKGKETDGWVNGQTERARRLLYNDLKPLFDKNTKMVNDEEMKSVLLPQEMSYKNKEFTYRFGFGKGEEKTILPPDDSKSALDDVDLEDKTLFL